MLEVLLQTYAKSHCGAFQQHTNSQLQDSLRSQISRTQRQNCDCIFLQRMKLYWNLLARHILKPKEKGFVLRASQRHHGDEITCHRKPKFKMYSSFVLSVM